MFIILIDMIWQFHIFNIIKWDSFSFRLLFLDKEDNYGIENLIDHPTTNVSFLVIGDWGVECDKYDCTHLYRVIQSMEQIQQQLNTSFVISTGDQFYENGVESVNSNRFRVGFEELFPKSLGDFYLILGNHDVRLNPKAQIEYSKKSKRWKMPDQYFMQDFEIPWRNPKITIKPRRVRLLFLNTNSLLCNHNEWKRLSGLERHECDEMWYNLSEKHRANPTHLIENYFPPRDVQLEWLKEKIEQSAMDDNIAWVLIVGHHPLFSRGPHGIPAMLNKYLRPLFQKHEKIVAYLSGHNHGMEYYIWDRYNQYFDASLPKSEHHYFHTFMSGAAAATPLHLLSDPAPESLDSSIHLGYVGIQIHGFMSICISLQTIVVQIWNELAQELYSVTIPP